MPNDPILDLPVYCLDANHPGHDTDGNCITCGYPKYFPEGWDCIEGEEKE